MASKIFVSKATGGIKNTRCYVPLYTTWCYPWISHIATGLLKLRITETKPNPNPNNNPNPKPTYSILNLKF